MRSATAVDNDAILLLRKPWTP